MTSVEVIEAYYRAFSAHDGDGIRAMITDDFTFRGPMMQFDNAETYVQAMTGMQIPGSPTGSSFIVDGDRVAHVFEWEIPGASQIPMCEVITIDGDKIAAIQLYFDSKLMQM